MKAGIYIIILGLIMNTLLFIGGCSNQKTNKVLIEQFAHKQASSKNNIYPLLGDIYNFLNEQHIANPKETALFDIGKTNKNNLTIPLIRIGFLQANPEKKILIVAGTHGDEAAPVAALNYVIENLLESQMLTMLVNNKIAIDFVPVHNPEGYLENQRDNDNGIDVNRNFPFGNINPVKEVETSAIVRLVNEEDYTVSIFLHSANEINYENLVRIPVEYEKTGIKALQEQYKKEVERLCDIIIEGGNMSSPEIPWHSSSDMVNVTGLASDWCMSGFLTSEHTSFVQEACKHSHPSVTIELCYPKQPLEKQRIELELEELLNIVMSVINKF